MAINYFEGDMAGPKKLKEDFRKELNNRSVQFGDYREVGKIFAPQKYIRFFEEKPSNYGITENSLDLFDSKPATSARLLGLILSGFMTPYNVVWFGLGSKDPSIAKRNDAVRRWLYGLRDLIWTILSDRKSGTHRAFREFFYSMVVFGPGYLFRMVTTQGFRLYNIPFNEMIVVRDEFGAPMIWYRWFNKRAGQVKDKWGYTSKNAVEDDYYTPILHVCKRGEGDRWESLYLHYEDEVILDRGGYRWTPFVEGAWTPPEQERDGDGLAIEHLPEARRLQIYAKELAASAMLANRPPHWAPEGEYQNRNHAFEPGAIFYYPADVGEPKPITLGLDPRSLENEYGRIHEGFNEKFFLSYILPVLFRSGKSPLKATEALELRDNAFRLIGPITQSWENEVLGEIIMMLADAVVRFRMYPPPPEELRGGVKLNFLSSAALAAKSADLEPIRRWLELYAFMAGFSEDAKNVLNPERTLRLAEAALNVDPDVLNSQQELEGIKRQMQQERALAGIMGGSEAVRNVGQGVNALAQAGAVQ